MEKISKYIIILLENYRKEHKFSQEKISSYMGISRRHYQDLIVFKYSPKFDTLYEMCEGLNLSLADLIYEAEELKVTNNKNDAA